MIARLSGRLAAVERDSAIVDVGGVGYRVHLSSLDLADLGPAGSEVALHTHLHVRDSELTLFGAVESGALELFQALLGVTGIGPRLAMAVMGADRSDRLRALIESEDVTALTRVPGVGKKTAQRIIFDLKGRLPNLDDASGAPAPPDEALEALLALGYSRREALVALEAAGSPDIEDRIREALRALSS